ARFTATVVLPTPPLPLPIATTCATPGRGCGPCGTPCPICPIMSSERSLVHFHCAAPRRKSAITAVVPLFLFENRIFKHSSHPAAQGMSPASAASRFRAVRAGVRRLHTAASGAPLPEPPVAQPADSL